MGDDFIQVPNIRFEFCFLARQSVSLNILFLHARILSKTISNALLNVPQGGTPQKKQNYLLVSRPLVVQASPAR